MDKGHKWIVNSKAMDFCIMFQIRVWWYFRKTFFHIRKAISEYLKRNTKIHGLIIYYPLVLIVHLIILNELVQRTYYYIRVPMYDKWRAYSILIEHGFIHKMVDYSGNFIDPLNLSNLNYLSSFNVLCK